MCWQITTFLAHPCMQKFFSSFFFSKETGCFVNWFLHRRVASVDCSGRCSAEPNDSHVNFTNPPSLTSASTVWTTWVVSYASMVQGTGSLKVVDVRVINTFYALDTTKVYSTDTTETVNNNFNPPIGDFLSCETWKFYCEKENRTITNRSFKCSIITIWVEWKCWPLIFKPFSFNTVPSL